MRVMAISGGFGLEQLVPIERPMPQPGSGQIVVQIKAVSLNYRDLLMVRGQYNPRQPLPLVPCSDGAGEVVAVGEGVSRVAVGDRVAPIFSQGWIGGPPTRERIRSTLGGPLDGTLAQAMCVSEQGVVKLPRHLSWAEAACLPCAALTAWSALVSEGQLRAGETVLIEGTGGVAIFALQLAKLLGARVIATSSSEQKMERLRELGADAVVNYRTDPDWGKTVRELAGGDGVDHVLELGGAKTLDQSLRALRIGGRLYLIGSVTGGIGQVNLFNIMMKYVRVQGIVVGSRDRFEAMNRAIALHELQPVIDERSFAFEQAREAFEYLASAEHFGKVTLTL